MIQIKSMSSRMMKAGELHELCRLDRILESVNSIELDATPELTNEQEDLILERD